MVASARRLTFFPTRYLHLSQGYTAEYIDVGEGLPLILVPGLAGGIDLLSPLIDLLSQHFRVVSYQLRGENCRVFERGFSFQRLVEDLGEVITALRLERPGVVGVSFGAAIALEYATRNSQRLSFLAVQGAGKDFKPGILGNVAREVLNRLPLAGNNPFVNKFFNVLIGHSQTEEERFNFIVDSCWRTDQSVMAHRLAMLDDYDLENRLSTLRTPTLILGCDRDVVVPVRAASEFASRIPQSCFRRIRNGGHLAFVTHTKRVCAQIRRFSKTVAAN